ncbi:MAG: hypothetical protein J0I06_13040 [Planctomycetes bacterium]|nr:hypothetical protein [Planctomycetota bacterium]
MRELALVVGTIVFAVVHFLWYSRVVAFRPWELSGGIQHEGRLTHYGTSDWAWTVPAHLPAGLSFSVGLGGPGILFLFAGSLAAGFAAAELLLALRGRSVLGRRRWRLWLFLAGWVWVPVPAPVSWVYQWTVVY